MTLQAPGGSHDSVVAASLVSILDNRGSDIVLSGGYRIGFGRGSKEDKDEQYCCGIDEYGAHQGFGDHWFVERPKSRYFGWTSSRAESIL